MGGGFLREYNIKNYDNIDYANYPDYGEEYADYGPDYKPGGDYKAGEDYGDVEYSGADYRDGNQEADTKLPGDEYDDDERERRRRRRRRRRQTEDSRDYGAEYSDDYGGDYEAGGDSKAGESIDYELSNNEIGGALQTNKTWLYNGNSWEARAEMSIARDRPACSIVNMPNGEVISEFYLFF